MRLFGASHDRGPRTCARSLAVTLTATLTACTIVGCTADAPAPPPAAAPPTTTPPAVIVPAAQIDATNTGWQHTGVQLQQMVCGPSNEVVIDRDHTVIDGMRIPCTVFVRANDVTISRSEVTSSGPFGIRKDDAFANLTVTDTEVIGTSSCAVGVGFSGVTMNRINVHGCADGVHPETGSILENSWIHGLETRPGPDGGEPHNDGVQTTGGSDIVIRNNKIENPHRQTSTILIGGEFGKPSNIMIEDNFLDGGNYTIYLDPQGTNRVVRNNTFTKNYVYGPDAIQGSVTWTDNTYVDGSPVLR